MKWIFRSKVRGIQDEMKFRGKVRGIQDEMKWILRCTIRGIQDEMKWILRSTIRGIQDEMKWILRCTVGGNPKIGQNKFIVFTQTSLNHEYFDRNKNKSEFLPYT